MARTVLLSKPKQKPKKHERRKKGEPPKKKYEPVFSEETPDVAN